MGLSTNVSNFEKECFSWSFVIRNMTGWLVTARKGDVFLCVFLMATFFMWLEIDGNRTSQQLIFGVGDLKSMLAFFVENDAVPMGQKQGPGEPAGSTSMFYL